MREMLTKKNVVAVIHDKKIIKGVNTGRPAIVVIVTKKEPLDQLRAQDIVPEKIAGTETDVQVGPRIVALALDRTKKWRPMPGGVSVGHYNITAGSSGPVVKKKSIRHTLSNSHVYADSGNAEMHDPILQPGPHDGGTSDDIIAYLAAFAPITFLNDESTCPFARFLARVASGLAELFGRYSRFRSYSSAINKVDCAIARPIADTDISDEILEVGVPTGFSLAELQPGEILKKSGRTTGLNQGTVIDTQGMANVWYGDKLAMFEDQIIASAMAEGGDSGSGVLNNINQVIGLLFAGSETMTIINKIGNVIDALGLDRDE
jgi:hypothetical protein